MNTIRSTWVGWGVLIVAGGGSYYFAKRSINADRAARHAEDVKRRRLMESLEYSATAQQAPREKSKQPPDHAGNPSGEASHDPAPTGHALEGDGLGKSKYEPKEPYRAKKGDRFS
ncbi:hypothetical protein MMC30_007907 [Trapelia coarctata]|nr:hypothetical protein [Trapelia coarctata]